MPETAVLRPVTVVEGQNFEIPEDPTHSLPERSPVGPIIIFFSLSRIPRKTVSCGDLGQHLLDNSQADLGLDAA